VAPEPDPTALAEDLAALVRIPSLTGRERPALEWLAARAEALGLHAELTEHDLAALRAHPDHPGEEAPRDELVGLAVTLPGRGPRRLCLDGHVDVVGPGTVPWTHGDPYSGAIEDGRIYGRGTVDMKAGVVAALHALAAYAAAGVVPAAEVVLLCVGSEEDGGLGTFAALQADARFDAALIPEPTGFDVVCAQAGALTFQGEVGGRAAHAAERLHGRSALDRYVELHRRFAEHERAINAGIEHPLMRELPLPYPINVGRIEGGEWSSSVPDRLTFEGRLGVPVGVEPRDATRAFEALADDGEEPPVRIAWDGGFFAPGETPHDHPFVALVAEAVKEQRGGVRIAGVPWGADMRLFTGHGIPCAMAGTTGIERAHAVDEWVALDEVVAVARIVARVIDRFG
jgi:acetylornithine deacetylase